MLKKGSKNIPLITTQGNTDVKARLKYLNEKERYAVLATDSDGQPFTSLIAYALTDDLKGVIFATPKNTSKYKNILQNPRVSVLIDSRFKSGCDYLNTESVTIIGIAHPLRKGRKRTELSSILMKKHSKLSTFIKSSTTALILIGVAHYIHVGNFQCISEWQVKTPK